MIGAGELRKGLTIEIDGTLYYILEYRHIKLGRGTAQVRLRLRDIRTGATVEKTFQASQTFKKVDVEEHPARFLYKERDIYHFMDLETFDQYSFSKEDLGDMINYLKEDLEVEVSIYDGKPVGISLPTTVDLRVVETPPGFKGDTTQSGGKPATLETGLVVTVPFFIEVGDIVRVDTRTGEYVERVS